MNYTGKDLIFATGAPGSKWSRILALIGLHPSINNSDKDKFPRYNKDITSLVGKTMKVGNHTGAYFGPYNNIGEDFDDLTKLSKEYFLEEIKKAFNDWETGSKIIKSHWFSYQNNLDWLRKNFPDAKIILAYNGDDVAFKWWHFVGGWDIDFPIYTWYNNDSRMYEKILEENIGLINFARKNLVPIQFYSSVKEILIALELSEDLEFLESIDLEELDLITKGVNVMDRFNAGGKGCALGILTSTSKRCLDTSEFDHIMMRSKRTAYMRHTEFKVDHLLEQLYGNDWLKNINSIVRGNDK